MVRFPRGIVMMDVRMVSSGVPMIKRAHDIDRMRSNRRWSLYRRKENHLQQLRQCGVQIGAAPNK